MGQQFGLGWAGMANLHAVVWGHKDSDSAGSDSNNCRLEFSGGFIVCVGWLQGWTWLELLTGESMQASQCGWVFSQHGTWVPRGIKGTRKKYMVSLDAASDITQNCFHYTPLIIGKSQRPTQIQGEGHLDGGVASSHCQRTCGVRDTVVTIPGKGKLATTLLMVIFALFSDYSEKPLTWALAVFQSQSNNHLHHTLFPSFFFLFNTNLSFCISVIPTWVSPG